MTCIAALAVEGLPVVMSDLLLSSPQPSGVVVETPIHGEIPSDAGSQGMHVSSLRQKMCVQGRTALAWAGSPLAAEALWQEMESRSEGNIDNATVSAVLSDAHRIVGDLPVNCVGFTTDGTDLVSVSYDAEEFRCRQFGRVYAAGSGAAALRSQMEGFASDILPVAGEPSKPYASFAKAISLTGALLEADLRTGSSLAQFYGGGYEVATLGADEQFHKIDDVLYAFWRGKREGSRGYLSDPLLVLKQEYKNCHLIVRSFRPTDGDTPSLRKSLFTIRPLSRPCSSTPVIEGTYLAVIEAVIMCSYVLVESDQSEPALLSTVDFNPNGVSHFRYTQEENDTLLEFGQDYLLRLMKLIATNNTPQTKSKELDGPMKEGRTKPPTRRDQRASS